MTDDELDALSWLDEADEKGYALQDAIKEAERIGLLDRHWPKPIPVSEREIGDGVPGRYLFYSKPTTDSLCIAATGTLWSGGTIEWDGVADDKAPPITHWLEFPGADGA